MNLHEYQSKRLFADYGITVPKGIAVKSPNAAVDAAKELGGDLWVVKAQVHAGGRGKAGGVKLARTRAEVHQYAEQMLGKQLVTHQSGPEGLPVNVVYVESGSDIREDLGKLANDNNWGIRELHRETATLEDVFVEMTQNEHTAA